METEGGVGGGEPMTHNAPELRDAALLKKLGDFTMTPASLRICGLAVVIGFVSAYIALALIKLIGSPEKCHNRL